MKTDSIFFQIFQTLPQLFFEILGESAEQGDYYEFTSVEVKQTAFRIDGVFLPKPDAPENTVIFVEFQFQQDEAFYERFASEIFLYLRHNSSFDHWRAIAVYPRRNVEQSDYECHRFFVESKHVQRVYLEDFLGESSEAIGIQLMQLIVAPKKETGQYLDGLVEQLQEETIPERQDIIDLITTVMVYKFKELSEEEIRAMFTLSEMEQTRVYQDAWAGGREAGREEGRVEGREEGRVEGREEGITEGVRRALAEALRRERELLLLLLNRKFEKISPTLTKSVQSLSFEQLKSLAKALFDFKQPSDLEAWLKTELADRPTNSPKSKTEKSLNQIDNPPSQSDK